jgi:solute carrier family 35 protein
VGISWAGINAQAYVTATTFMVLANLNKFVVVGFGILVLQEASSWQVGHGGRGWGMRLGAGGE